MDEGVTPDLRHQLEAAAEKVKTTTAKKKAETNGSAPTALKTRVEELERRVDKLTTALAGVLTQMATPSAQQELQQKILAELT